MRTVDLAVYADTLAAEAATLAARLERARGRMRRRAIEREARESLPAEVVARLHELGLLQLGAGDHDAGELEELRRSLAAVETLQAWVETRLLAEGEVMPSGYATARSGSPASSAAR